jgi:copper(I)-binding protein
MKRILAFFLALPALAFTCSSAAASLEVQDAWVREAPPTASVLAAYMTIRNAGTTPAEITNITSPDFGHIEMHRTVVEHGIASMVPVGTLEIPPGEQITLEPGGTHLMLIDPRRTLRAGDTLPMTILDAAGQTTTFSVPVIREAGEAGHHH